MCAAINLLGLTWQLKSSDATLSNNGLGSGMAVNSEVATLPSGGRGENYTTHSPSSFTQVLTSQQVTENMMAEMQSQGRRQTQQ